MAPSMRSILLNAHTRGVYLQWSLRVFRNKPMLGQFAVVQAQIRKAVVFWCLWTLSGSSGARICGCIGLIGRHPRPGPTVGTRERLPKLR